MATKKKLLQAAAGTAAASGGAGGLNVEQVFSTYLYDGNGSSQVIENGVNLGQSFGSGSADFDGNDYITSSSGYLTSIGTGDFTIEGWWYFKDFTARTYFTRCWSFGTGISDDVTLNVNTSGELQYRNNDAVKIAGSTTISTNTWYHIALCRSSGTTTLYLDGTSIGSVSNSVNFSTVANNSFYVGAEAGGGGGYANGYVSNIRIVNGTAVYTSSFTPSTSALTAISGTSLLTLQGDSPFVDNSSSALTITQNGDPKASSFGPFDAADAGEGGLVWIKNRTGADNHWLADTERGTSVVVSSSGTFANVANNNRFVSFNSNGFSLGNNGSVNGGTYDYASWTFRKAPKFFDVVTATAPSSGTLQVSHNLGTTVGCIILKSTSDTDNWVVYHRGMGANYYATMNQTNPWINVAGVFDGVTDTYFTLDPNKNCTAGRTYVAYVFAHNDGDGTFGPTGDQDVISCGTFTSDSNGDISVELGWEPQFVLYRRTDQGGVWIMTDTMRGMSVNGGTNINYLAANASNVEANNATGVYPTPTGIGGNFNASANTPAIYIAIRRGPMAVPTDATDVFDVGTYTSTGVAGNNQTTGFPVDFALIRGRTASNSWYWGASTRLLGGTKYLSTSSTNGIVDNGSAGGIRYDDMEGFSFDSAPFNNDGSMVYLAWQRARGHFDVVAYTGTQVAGLEINHNLGVAPEMIWVKNRDSSADWRVWHKDVNGHFRLNSSAVPATDVQYHFGDNTNFVAPTDTVITLGTHASVNYPSGTNYVAYLFASLDGVSKVGSISHTNGTPTNVDCGFSAGARFIILKRYDASSNWWVFDTERGIAVGNDARLYLDIVNAEQSTDQIDPYSAGFTIDSNRATGDYIFYAIA